MLPKSQGSTASWQVSWIHVDKQSLLTSQEHVITSNSRIKVHHEAGTWTLIINKVSLEDRGYYMCQISSQPPKSQVGFLDVVGKCAQLAHLHRNALFP